MNIKKLNSRKNGSPGAAGLKRKLNKMNLYEIHQKILNGKQTSWMENAIYAGFTPDEIVSMVEANLEQLQPKNEN